MSNGKNEREGVLSTSVSRFITAYTNLGKVSSVNPKVEVEGLRETGVEEDSRPKMQDYTTADNGRDVYLPSAPRIHEKYSTEAVFHEHLWRCSYCKTTSFGAECFEETRVIPKPP
ncbi:hypothetical protein TNCV_4069441 [Trichonephila clavipes]|nr:hypothetical protein TNCV_4069441 [Trichonephila clavipes]